MAWFRWHHGTVADPKLRVVAKRADAPLSAVVAVWASLLEHASQNDPRGSISGFDTESVAENLDLTESSVVAIQEAMRGRLHDGERLTGWETRQPVREDDSAERVAKHRAAKRGDVTRCNALKRDVTLEESRVEEIREEQEGERGIAPIGAPPLNLDHEAWDRWKQYRSSIKKPIKAPSVEAAQRKLAAFGKDQAAVVEQSIANGWQGLFALKDQAKKQQSMLERVREANGLVDPKGALNVIPR